VAGDDVREAEAAVLGSMIRDNGVIGDVLDVVGVEDFWSDAHRSVFAAAVALYDAGRPVDAVTLAEHLKQQGVIENVGYPYLGELLDAAPTAANAGYYAGIVRDKALLRRLAEAGDRIVAQATAPTGAAGEVLETAEKEVFAIAESAVSGGVVSTDEVVSEVFDYIDACATRGGAANGVPTGFDDLDLLTAGLQQSSLTLIAARPGVGKTSLGLQLARNVCRATGRPVFFASLEMSRHELILRLMCAEAKVNSQKVKKGLLNDDETARMAAAGAAVRRPRFFIDDRAAQTMLRIGSNARRLKRKHNIAAVFVDYLQLIEPENRRESRREQVGSISRRLKCLAKELDIPVIAMCQLNREVEKRTDQRPRLADLRESGDLEQDSDTVALLHRPAESPGVVQVIIAKQRNGPTGVATLTFVEQFTRFENYEAEQPPLGGG
jgi:replicative DNA helicase